MTKLSNPKRSGGPKTAEGKAVAARNSLKTGAYASAMILPGESEAEFLELKESLLVDLQAVGILESALVNELSAIVWKKLRLDQVEHRSVVQCMHERLTAKSFYSVGLPRQLEFDIALNHPWFWDTDCIKHIELSKKLIRSMTKDSDRAEELKDIEKRLPVLYWRMVEWVRDESNTWTLFNVSKKDFEYLKIVAVQSGIWYNLLAFVWQELSLWVFKEFSAIEFALVHKSKIEALIPQVMDQRLMRMMQLDGVTRARDDLDRAFFRGLKALRVEQEWRLKHQVIDITPKAVNAKTD